jgi:glycosyltransferase involved in cell wall biosynthesis
MASIGLLTTSYPTSESDVSGIFVRGFARALASRGHHVSVIAPEPLEGSPPRDPNIDVHWVPYVRPRSLARTFYGAGVPDNVRRDPRAWIGLATYPLALDRCVRERGRDWDALVSHWALPCAIAAGRARGDRPHLAVLHSADVHLLRRLPLRARIARSIAQGATQLLFASSALRNELLSWIDPLARADLAARCHSSAMGIDPASGPSNRRDARKRLGARRFVVLSLGRLVPIKGVSLAMEAVEKIEDAELWIAGDGPCRRDLERAARGFSSRVRFFGTVTGRDKSELLRAADVFVAPSLREPSGRTEGLPTTLLEAAQAGVPIIASGVGGIPEVFEHDRSALLVEAGDRSALADAILRVRDDSALRKKLARSAARIAKRYLWSELAPRIEGLLFDR